MTHNVQRLIVGCLCILVIQGCALVKDIELSEQNLKQGYVEQSLEDLMYLAEKGYHEADLALGDYFLLSKQPDQLQRAQKWYQKRLADTDAARLGYIRWMAKMSHYNPEYRPISFSVLQIRQQRHKDVAVEYTRFIQDYYPQSQHIIYPLIEEMKDDPNVKPKDTIRVIDSLQQPENYMSLLRKLCKLKEPDTLFYCLRTELRYAKLKDKAQIPQLIENVITAFADRDISIQHIAALIELMGTDKVGEAMPDVAYEIAAGNIDDSDALFLALAKQEVNEPYRMPAQELEARLISIHEKGNPSASLLLAKLYDKGFHVAPDPWRAETYLKAASSEPEARYLLGRLLLNGKLGDSQAQLGVDNLLSAARDYYPPGYRELADVFMGKYGIYPNSLFSDTFTFIYQRLSGELSPSDPQFPVQQLSTNGSGELLGLVQREINLGLGFWQAVNITDADLALITQ